MWVSVCVGLATAQTDYTEKITNPSFENDWTGWVHSGFGIQDNSVFDIKDQNVYAEKWTGRGGQVGSASVSQVLTDLPPGNYELTAAAQNIQEDTPKAAQTGAWIFAGDKKTTVTVRDTYTVAFNHVSGKVEIGFEAKNATGNWISVDNFRLTLVGGDLTAELAAAIEKAEADYGNATGKESEQLTAAINTARSTYATATAQPGSVSVEDQAAAIIGIEQAIDIYLCANASADNPLDLTSKIVNPSFETGDLTGWTAEHMGTQGNSVFSIKQGNIYVEKWTGRGGAVGDALLKQTLTDMQPGRYRLIVAAQNIQEDTPTKAQTGAWIFANTHTMVVEKRQQYTLEFVLVSNILEIGFKAQGATGNWLAVDNFRLEYISDNTDDVKTELAAMIAHAETLAAQKTNPAAHQALETAIANAKQQLEGGGNLATVATALEEAIATAEASQAIFARLATAIADARQELAASAATQTQDFQTAIDAAQTIYDGETTTDADAEAAITALAEASFVFKVTNADDNGNAPTVVTDKRFVRGATWAFGRSTVSGSNIKEEGFCWAEHPDPKVTDNRTTEYLDQAGKVYWLRDLKPATVYYMRAYAMTNDYAVGYGDVIKVVTVPKGTIGHWYNNGGDEETNNRINNAINTAMDYYWNNLTSIHGFGISVTYSPGTPTADCGYGGGMRVGASSSYQQVGTIMHEALHGIGVGTHGIWWNGDMRSAGNRGDWLGDRVTEAVRFWDNNTTGVITGDDMHLWPYGCNGAQEDTHSDNLYCMMGILAQALNEDGLPGSGEIGYALPYYSFNHEDGVKYYLKNEDENCGLHTSYLVETATHQLQWKAMTADEAAADDHAAWYLTFTPDNQYYQLRNAATGYYMTYNSGIKTANHSKATAADNFHLMRGRVEVEKHRGYYIIHPESSSNPPVLAATANGVTAVASFQIERSATKQRWLILTADEALAIEEGNLGVAKKELADYLANLRKLAETPHTEDVADANATFTSALNTIDAAVPAIASPTEASQLMQQAKTACMDFLKSVTATDKAQPFDLTFMLQNPDFANDATTGWTTATAPGYGGGGAEFYEKTFNFYQILNKMPAGTYRLNVQAFQRPGEPTAVYTQYKAGTSSVNTVIYLNGSSATVKHICDDSQTSSLHSGDKQLATGVYVPNVMDGAARYFAKGLYDNSVSLDLKTSNTNLRVGIRGTKTASYHWTMFDNFRLFYLGNATALTGITGIEDSNAGRSDVYDLSGRKVVAPKKGLYIINGKKIIIE